MGLYTVKYPLKHISAGLYTIVRPDKLGLAVLIGWFLEEIKS